MGFHNEDETVTALIKQAEAEKQEVPPPQTRISLRALLLAMLLIPLNCYWVILSELRWYTILTINPLFVTPVFYLFVLVLINSALQRWTPRWRFTRAELVLLYIMLVMSCTIATHDFMINLISIMPWGTWFASPQNNWENALFPHLPRHLLVWDRELVKGFFQGSDTLYRWEVIRAWLAPLAFWGAFILCLGWMFLCLNVILRKAWVDEVRLSFPIVRLPLELTEGFSGGSVLRSRIFWLGVIVAGLFNITNGLQEWFPALPHFETRAQPIRFTEPPWTAVGWFVRTFYPFAIGLAFLVPLDVSFSCWFFYLFIKAQMVIGHQLGYGNVPDYPFTSEQGIGAWATYGLVLLYASRRYFQRALHVAFHRSEAEDGNEPLSYRLAFWGLLLGMVFFVAFWWFAGMQLHWALVVLAAYLLLAVSITRVRAEAGGQHTVWDLEPMRLFRLFDHTLFTPSTLGAAAISHWYWRLNRSHIMPSQMEAMKLAQQAGLSLGKLAVPIILALMLSILFSSWACLHVLYVEGGLAKCLGFARWTGYESYNWLDGAIKSGYRAEINRWGVVAAASGFTIILMALRTRFVGFPFHPLGYCVGPGLVWLWLPFFIAWLVKFFILRYGGLRMYRRALPFFLGLILSDYLLGALWSLIGNAWEVPTHQIFH